MHVLALTEFHARDAVILCLWALLAFTHQTIYLA